MSEKIKKNIEQIFGYRNQIYLGNIFDQNYEFYIEFLINTFKVYNTSDFFKTVKSSGVADKNQKQDYSIYIVGKYAYANKNETIIRTEYSTIFRLYFVDRMSHAHQILLRENNPTKYYEFLNEKVILLRQALDKYFPVDNDLRHLEYKLRRKYSVKT